MLRRIVLEHDGHRYRANVRNLSATGALVEGLWHVPSGTILTVHLADRVTVAATVRWCEGNRTGIEFATPVELDEAGRAIGTAHGGSLSGGAPGQRRNG